MTDRKTRIQVVNERQEPAGVMLRKFTKRTNNSGIVRGAKKKRFFERAKSDLNMKRSALHRLDKKARFERLWKLGRALPKK